uniref:Glycosyltransferase family 92 protein n=1 Tax=Parascaris univalens TaxID=6257 RepID=A0A915BUX9_PARUN
MYARVRIRLIDSRVDSSRPRPHRLAICVSPIMQLAAWMWILHGATKFYPIVQSMTSEFDAMLRIYENDPTIDIERIPWGMFPTEEDVNSEDNPNNQITGAEDEPRFVRHPSNLSFYPLGNISLENRIYPVGSLSKIIVRPERTKSVNVHEPRDMEDKKYKTLTVDPVVAQFFHLRLVDNVQAHRNTSLPNNELNKYIPQWERQYSERIDAETRRMIKRKVKENRVTIANKEWPNRSYQVAEEMEECFMKYYLAEETCSAHTKCFPNVTAVRMDEWIFGETTAVIL